MPGAAASCPLYMCCRPRPRQPRKGRPLTVHHLDQLLPVCSLVLLASAAPVLLNLTPDDQGVVHIQRKALGDRQQVQVYAENLTSAVWRTLAVGELQAKFEDQRLARNLDPAKAFTEKKTATVLTTGKTLTLADILTSEMEKYDSLASVHSLYLSLSGDAKLAQFGWVLKWPELKVE